MTENKIIDLANNINLQDIYLSNGKMAEPTMTEEEAHVLKIKEKQAKIEEKIAEQKQKAAEKQQRLAEQKAKLSQRLEDAEMVAKLKQILADEKKQDAEQRAAAKEADKKRIEALTQRFQLPDVEDGKILQTPANYEAFIEHCEFGGNLLVFNDLTQKIEWNGRPYDDTCDVVWRKLFGDTFKGRDLVNEKKIRDAVEIVAHKHVYHPIKNYLEGLKWDGKQRAETLFIDWLGVEDTEMHREMTKIWLMAAVKRLYRPGTKFDNMIVLYGEQGNGKSTICQRLALDRYYAENPDVTNKDGVDVLQNSWIMLMDELTGLSKKDMNAVKNFLTRTQDVVRLSYERHSKTFDRHVVFIGTTNEENFLRDYSSNDERRYWILECKSTDRQKVFKGFTREIVDQIWAETMTLYRQNEDVSLYLNDRFKADLIAEQKAHKTYNNDPDVALILDELDLNYRLTDGEFKDLNDIKSQCEIRPDGAKDKIMRISSAQLKKLCDTRRIKWKSLKVLEMASNGEWEYKTARLKNNENKTAMCLIRKNADTEMEQEKKDFAGSSFDRLFDC